MKVGITDQAYIFLIFILNGLLIGIIFDIFRILRKSFKTPNLVTYIEDALFWIISAIIVMYSLFVFNDGQFRAYIFIGIFVGIALYMLFFSKSIIKVSTKIIEIVKNIISFILHILLYPVNIIYHLISKIIIAPIVQISTKSQKSLAKFVKKHYNIKSKVEKHGIVQNKEGF